MILLFFNRKSKNDKNQQLIIKLFELFVRKMLKRRNHSLTIELNDSGLNETFE